MNTFRGRVSMAMVIVKVKVLILVFITNSGPSSRDTRIRKMKKDDASCSSQEEDVLAWSKQDQKTVRGHCEPQTSNPPRLFHLAP